MKIAFWDTWYGIKAPEQENMLRYKYAFEKLGHIFEFITPDGFLERDLKKHIEHENFDLVLCTDASLDIMKFFPNTPVFFLYWCPYGYLGINHFKNYISSFKKFDAVLTSCYNQEFKLLKETFFNNIITSTETTCVFPSLSENDILPFKENLSDIKLFYAGINKDKGNKKGRYSQLLSLLDAEGCINLYGPNNNGKNCWNEYKCCCGEIPFDGRSIIHKIHEAGICLALHSKMHHDVGFITNRIFEACVAGVPIISDNNAYTQKFFEDNIFYIDIEKSEEKIFDDIIKIVEYVKSHQKETQKKIKNCQRIFRQFFTLEKSVNSIITLYKEYKSKYQYQPNELVDIVAFINNPEDIKNIEEQIKQLNNEPKSIIFSIPNSIINNCNLDQIKQYQVCSTDKFNYAERVIELKNKNFFQNSYVVFIDSNGVWNKKFLAKLKQITSLPEIIYTSTYYQKEKQKEILNDMQQDAKAILQILGSSNEEQVANISCKLEQNLLLNSFAFSKRILDEIDDNILYYKNNFHIYLFFKAYLENKNIEFYNELLAGTVKKNNHLDEYRAFYRVHSLLFTPLYLTFNKYMCVDINTQYNLAGTFSVIQNYAAKKILAICNIELFFCKIKSIIKKNQKHKEKLSKLKNIKKILKSFYR